MSLEVILQALEAEAERQVAEIEQAAQAEIDRIQAQARETAEAVRQEHLAAIQVPLRTEQTRLLNRAKLEAMQTVIEAREAMLNLLLATVAQHLVTLSTTSAYGRVLKQLMQEASETLAVQGRLQVRVLSRDVPLMEGVVQELALPAVVKGGLESEASAWGGLGGAVVTTPDGSVSLDNTLDQRLQRATRLYRSHIAELLFTQNKEG
jgi:vacuolar-type H+-ATPase subunit E/Vma4